MITATFPLATASPNKESKQVARQQVNSFLGVVKPILQFSGLFWRLQRMKGTVSYIRIARLHPEINDVRERAGEGRSKFRNYRDEKNY